MTGLIATQKVDGSNPFSRFVLCLPDLEIIEVVVHDGPRPGGAESLLKTPLMPWCDSRGPSRVTEWP